MDVGVLVGQRPPPQDLEPVLARLVIQRVSSRTGHVIVPRPPVGHPFPTYRLRTCSSQSNPPARCSPVRNDGRNRDLIAPWVALTLRAACRFLPFSLGWQPLMRPPAVGVSLKPSDGVDRMQRPFRLSPVGEVAFEVQPIRLRPAVRFGTGPVVDAGLVDGDFVPVNMEDADKNRRSGRSSPAPCSVPCGGDRPLPNHFLQVGRKCRARQPCRLCSLSSSNASDRPNADRPSDGWAERLDFLFCMDGNTAMRAALSGQRRDQAHLTRMLQRQTQLPTGPSSTTSPGLYTPVSGGGAAQEREQDEGRTHARRGNPHILGGPSAHQQHAPIHGLLTHLQAVYVHPGGHRPALLIAGVPGQAVFAGLARVGGQ